ncbi:TetR/AcrR family transcriptional regulator [Trujillonella endophytica]|uniref:Transcriptional regulator, TetR family n=1 Tax=Trujillonella endophytica TaxID=673521 RepID=A0A1H8UTV9_9ACTN|nr:TetR family transcriptional regulator [Trujillella endophytica]SEP06344.1 transcriptional regulator, TetR family [Trujillella endophytica]
MPRLAAGDRREALVEAALRVMGRDGLAAGTTRAVVAEAGMSLASFHYVFASRDELLAELVRRVVGRELATATAALDAAAIDPAAGPADCLRAAARGYLGHLEADPGAEQLMLELTLHAVREPDLRPVAREQYRAYAAAAAALLERAAARTGARWRGPLAEPARVLVTLVDGATTTWLVDRDTAATRATLDAAVDLLVARYAVVPA